MHPIAPPVQNRRARPPAADNGVRFGAYLLEGLLFVVTLAVGWIIWSLISWSKGQSPAKQVLGLVVVDQTGRPATWGTMFLREVVGKWLLGTVSFGITSVVGAFMILFSQDRRGVWDSVAGTTVVRLESLRQGSGHDGGQRSRPTGTLGTQEQRQGQGQGQVAAFARPVQPQPGQWAPDPYGRFRQRYYDGQRWTEHVSNGGPVTSDPLPLVAQR